MSRRDEARQSLTTWPTLIEWTREKRTKERDWVESQMWFNHMFGGSPLPINKATPPPDEEDW